MTPHLADLFRAASVVGESVDQAGRDFLDDVFKGPAHGGYALEFADRQWFDRGNTWTPEMANYRNALAAIQREMFDQNERREDWYTMTGGDWKRKHELNAH